MPPKKQPKRLWLPSQSAGDKPKISDEMKARAQDAADRLLDELRPVYVKPAPKNPRFNYTVDLSTVWFRSYLYLRSTNACVFPECIEPTFEVRFARMEYAGGDRFHLAYMRHTGQWWEVFRDQPLDGAIQLLRENVFFHP